jgi:beta-glucosidase
VIDVTNSGKVTGSEVVQLYLTSPTATGTNGESIRQLKSFIKVKDLSPSATETVTFSVSPRDLSAWDESIGDWRIVPGTYTVYVGSSSCDLRQSTTFVV